MAVYMFQVSALRNFYYSYHYDRIPVTIPAPSDY